MKKIYLLFFILAYLLSFSQTRLNRDSALSALGTSKADTSKVKLYFSLASDYVISNTDSAKIFWNQGKNLTNKLNAHQFDFDYYYTGVKIFHAEQDYEKALDYNLLALKNSEKNRKVKQKADALRSLFIIYLNLRKDTLAIQTAHKALYLTQQINDSPNLSIVYGNLSRLYYELGQYEKSIVYGEKGIETGKKYNNIKGLLISFNNVALSKKSLGKTEQATQTFNELLQLAYKNKASRSVVKSLINLSFIAIEKGDREKLNSYITELNDFINKNPDAPIVASDKMLIHYLKGYNFLFQEELSKAEEEAIDGLENVKDDLPLMNSYYDLLVKINYAKKDFKKGQLFQKKYDSVSNILTQQDLNEFEINADKKYETQRKDAQIKLQNTHLKQRRMLNYFLAASVLALLLIAGLIYRNYKHRNTIQQQKINELETEKQLAATEAVLKGEEQERSRLAKDLHDGLGGMLSGVKHSFSAMKENLIMTPENALAFERSLSQLDNSIQEMRRVAHNMLPESLLKYGLDNALNEFCKDLNRNGRINVNYQSIDMTGFDFPQNIAITAYRVVQELANNTLKYSGAENLLVQANCSPQDGLLHLTVEDDGKGFDAKTIENSEGIGWKNIRSRISLLNGKIDLSSTPGKGSSILIEIPL